jgi:hypothetical protein
MTKVIETVTNLIATATNPIEKQCKSATGIVGGIIFDVRKTPNFRNATKKKD